MEIIDFTILQTKACFQLLNDKNSVYISDYLLQELNKTVSGTARDIYLYILEQARKEYICNQKYSPVIISAKTLTENCIYKSIRTIRRRLAELENKGFIIKEEISLEKNTKGVNVIYPLLPKQVISKLKLDKKKLVS